MSQRSRLNLIVVQALVASLIFILLGRLFYLQVADSKKYQDAALSIQSRDVVTPAVRGAITDSSGVPMVIDRPGMVITVDRSVIDRQPDKGSAVLSAVAKLLGLNLADVYQATRLCGELPTTSRTGCWNGTRYQPIPVTRTATEAQALKVLENSDIYPGIDAQPYPVRSYPSLAGENAAHVLGYVGSVTEADLADTTHQYYRNEVIGKSGLEYQYNQYLTGKPGVKTVIVNRTEAITQESQNTKPISGDNLVTNLDARLQAVTEGALSNSVRSARSMGYKADSGAAIVMDVKTGKVLAIASYPTYDPTMWEKGLTPQQAKDLFSASAGAPALSRPLQGEYAPGSTFKAISIAAASHAGYSLQGKYDCPATVQIGNRVFKNFETNPMGMIPMQQAIAVSCDTVWYNIAYQQWVRDGGLSPKSGLHDYFFKAAAGFGLGQKTGIDLPGELSGRLPDRAWKEAYYQANKNFYCNFEKRAKKSDLTAYLIAIAKENCIDGDKIRAGDAVNFSIGQGDTLMTPLQMAQVYSAIANGGTLYQPEVARAIVKPDGTVVKEFKPVVTGHTPTSSSDIAFLHAALRDVVTTGTAAPVFGSGYPVLVAGKTGTAQVLGTDANGRAKDDTSWFASFAPVNNPQYAVVVVVSQGGFGASVAAPAVKTIYNAIYGVTGSTINPAKALFPNGLPSKLPTIDPRVVTLKKP